MPPILKKLISLVLVFSFLTSVSHANDFLEGLEAFERGDFKGSSLKLLPLANQGDLFAQTYVRYMANQDKTLCPEGGFSFEDLTGSYYLNAIQDALKASVAKLKITSSASAIEPKEKKKEFDELKPLLERKNFHALVVMGDLVQEGKDVSSCYKKSQKIPPSSNFYDDAVQEGDFLGVLRLKTIENPLSPIQKKILQVVEISKKVAPLGGKTSQGQIYFSLFNYFKEKKEEGSQKLARNFCRMGAYHGHSEAQMELLAYARDKEEEGFWIERAAYQENPKAMQKRAWDLEQSRNFEDAFKLYLKVTEAKTADSSFSFYKLGCFHKNGQGTPINLEEALRCYRISYEKTNPKKLYAITDLYIFRCIIHVLVALKNPEALEWVKAGVEQGDPLSITSYARYFLNGNLDDICDGKFGASTKNERSPEDALKTLRKLALEKYNREAFMLLSSLLIEDNNLQGTSSEWDAVEKFLLECAATADFGAADYKTEKMNPDMVYNHLSLLYLRGRNETVPRDYEKGYFYLDQPMKGNFAPAYFQRGQMYAFYKKNKKKTFDCFQKAVELGHTRGWISLGLYYVNGGDGVPQSDKKAVECFREAMKYDDNGLAHRFYAMMMMYENSGGLICDEDEKILLLEKAVSLGDKTACVLLGKCYVGKKDIERAMMCFEEGKKAGNRQSNYELLLLKVQFLPMEKDRLTALKELEDAVQDEKDPEILFKCAALFIYNQNLHENSLEKGLQYLEKAIQNGSEEAQYLKDMLDPAKKERRAQAARDMRDYQSGDKGIEAVGLGSEKTEKETAGFLELKTITVEEAVEEPYQSIDYAALAEEKVLNPTGDKGIEEAGLGSEETEKELSILADLVTGEEAVEESYHPIDYAALAEEKVHHPKRKLQEDSPEKEPENRPISKKELKILDFLDPKSPRQVSVQKVFSMIGDLIKEKGGSLTHSKKGIRVRIGDETIFTHLQHGKRGGGHQSDMDGARLEGMREFMRKAFGDSAV